MGVDDQSVKIERVLSGSGSRQDILDSLAWAVAQRDHAHFCKCDYSSKFRFWSRRFAVESNRVKKLRALLRPF